MKCQERGTHCKRVIRSPLDRGIVNDDNALAPRYPPYSRNHTCARHGLARVYLVRSQGGEFKEGGVRVQEQRQPNQGRLPVGAGQKGKGTYLSRGSFFPLFRIRSAAFAPPPSRAFASFASRSATTSSIAFARAWNSGEAVEMSDGRTHGAAWYGLAVGAFDRDRRLSDDDDDDDDALSAVRRKSCDECILQRNFEYVAKGEKISVQWPVKSVTTSSVGS